MHQFNSPRSLYAAFDVFPSAKGAATHINRFAPQLFSSYNSGLLYVLGDETLPKYQEDESIEVYRFKTQIPNFLQRTYAYGNELTELLESTHETLEVCHFRDPWGGLPIVEFPNRKYKIVYEINGLPSIELPSLYPGISQSTLDKTRAIELHCANEADAIVTPSYSIKENLIGLGIDEDKITVIHNGADLCEQEISRPADAPEHYLIYVGALQTWQGVEVLLKAFAKLKDIDNLKLVICSSTKRRGMKNYKKLATRLELDDSIIWHERLPKAELRQWLKHATLSLAPLAECERNLDQGCCPLKILESMALGIPVIASDLPSVREIITDGETGILVRPERPEVLARTIRVALDHPEYTNKIAQAGQNHIRETFTWEAAENALHDLYKSLQTSADVPQ